MHLNLNSHKLLSSTWNLVRSISHLQLLHLKALLRWKLRLRKGKLQKIDSFRIYIISLYNANKKKNFEEISFFHSWNFLKSFGGSIRGMYKFIKRERRCLFQDFSIQKHGFVNYEWMNFQGLMDFPGLIFQKTLILKCPWSCLVSLKPNSTQSVVVNCETNC